MGERPLADRMPRGLRDTRDWYRDTDPMAMIDPALVEFVAGRSGNSLLDLGCGLGGYSSALGERGFDCRGLDVNEDYVEAARALGVRADPYDGRRVPLDDDAVDTVILLEVLEHLEQPSALLREAARVARANVLVSTPNCTQSFGSVPIEFSHMLDVDHRQFFTVDSLRELLNGVFGRCLVEQSHPLDDMFASLVLPRGFGRLARWVTRVHPGRPRFYSRLLGEAWPPGAAQ